jgi:DNA-binding NarL/FixJ family response regulator
MAVRVLVVDDQVTFRDAMTAVVAVTDGFECVGEAASGEASIAACRRLQPDLVLMDVNLGDIDGVAVTKLLLREPRAPVVLLLSTYDVDAGEVFVRESGAAGYIPKAELAPERLVTEWSAAVR